MHPILHFTVETFLIIPNEFGSTTYDREKRRYKFQSKRQFDHKTIKKATQGHEKAIHCLKDHKGHARPLKSLKAMLGHTWPHMAVKRLCHFREHFLFP